MPGHRHLVGQSGRWPIALHRAAMFQLADGAWNGTEDAQCAQGNKRE